MRLASADLWLATLETVIERRITERPDESYSANLVGQGTKRIAQKFGEEGLELALARVSETNERVIAEAADLLFHMTVMLKSRKLPLASVITELPRAIRSGTKRSFSVVR